MNRPLEELRAQRRLLEQHLEWLDRRIEEAEAREAPDPPVGAEARNAPATTIPEEPGEAPPPHDASAPSGSGHAAPSGTGGESGGRPPPFEDREPHLPDPRRTSDLQRAKIGCVGLFAAATLFFLFLLFGLPYFLD